MHIPFDCTPYDRIEHKQRTRELHARLFARSTARSAKKVSLHPSFAVLLNVTFQTALLLSALLQIDVINFDSATTLDDVPRSKRRPDTTNSDVFVRH